MNIFAYNPDTTELEKTYLTSRTDAGATTFKVKNTNNFANGRKVLIGEMGQERSEILTVSGVTATQLTLSAAEFPHDADDPIYLLEFDQVRFYRSTSGESGAYTILATVDIDVDNADNKTKYDDADALDTYWYQITYYDSVNDVESDPSGSIKAGGYPADTVGAVLIDYARRVKDPEFLIFSIEACIGIMNDVNDDLITQAKKPYRFLKQSPEIDIATGDDSFPYPTDLWKIDYVETNNDNYYYPKRPKVISPIDMRYRRQLTPQPADYVREVAYDDESDAVLFNPAARTDRIGAFTLHYYQFFTRFTSMSDTLQTPNGLVYKLALWREYYLEKANSDTKYLAKAQNYDNRYNTEVMKLQREKTIAADAPHGLAPQIKRYRQ